MQPPIQQSASHPEALEYYCAQYIFVARERERERRAYQSGQVKNINLKKLEGRKCEINVKQPQADNITPLEAYSATLE